MTLPPDAVERYVPPFESSQPTRLVLGSGVSADVGRYAATFGRRALVVCGQEHAVSTGLLERLEEALRAEQLVVERIEGVGSNPTVALVDAGAQLARSVDADVVVGVGGGSVIDVAKAIATSAALRRPRTYREHLSGLRPQGLLVDAALPVVAVPTLPGSASESNGTSVITDDVTGRKLSAHSDLAAPRIALLDTDLVLDAPAGLVAPGLADAWCHALEAALANNASVASDALAEQALRMLWRLGSAPVDVEDPQRALALAEAWWATNLAGQALTLAGSIATHAMAHSISARVDARHGEAVASLEGALLAVLGERWAGTGVLERIDGWLDGRARSSPDAALRAVLARLARYCSQLGVVRSATDLGVPRQLCGTIVDDALRSGSRGLANMPGAAPSPGELERVMIVAASCGPATSPSQLLEASALASAGAG